VEPIIIFFFIFILIVIWSVIDGISSWWFNRKKPKAYRRSFTPKTYQSWAELHGWSYSRFPDYEIHHHYSNFNHLLENQFAQSVNSKWLRPLSIFMSNLVNRSTYAHDVLQGTWHKYPASAFTVYVPNGEHSTSFGVVLIKLENENFFPKLQIYSRGIFNKVFNEIWNFLGVKDASLALELESEEFSKRFAVHYQDPEFAYDFCHPRMIDYLLARPGTSLILEGNILTLFPEGKIYPAKVEKHLEELIQLRELMPQHLFMNQEVW
jgi:hypothetical protein